MKQISRRAFIGGAAIATAASAMGAVVESKRLSRGPVKLGVSTYSYWHFRTPRVPIEKVIDHASALGVQGVDILHRQMDIEEKAPLDAAARAYCQKLKRYALLN